MSVAACGAQEIGGTSRGGGHALVSRGPLGHPPTYFFLLYKPTYPKNIQGEEETQFHYRNLLYPRDLILEPSLALCRRGNRPRRASTSTPLPLRRVVSSLPQTYGSIVIS